MHFGYRKGQGGGRWVVRIYKGNEQYVVETIGSADDGAMDADGSTILDFAQGQARAREIALARRQGVPVGTAPSTEYTVAACIADYLHWMEHSRKTAQDARYRANALILPALGAIKCDALTTDEIQKWLRAIAKDPARLRSRVEKGQIAKQNTKPASDDPEAARKRRATANRTRTILFAALNRAWREGGDSVRRRVAARRAFRGGRRRPRSLPYDRRGATAHKCGGAPISACWCAPRSRPAPRYGELAGLKVEDFNPDSGTLHVRTSKSGKGRHIVLADEGIALFAAQSAGRAPSNLLLPKADGSHWAPSNQNRPMKAACRGARIEPETNFHCLRHSYASHSIMNGAPLLVVAKNLGHADTRMVERHYGHLAPSYVADTIRAAAPRFGGQPNNVQTLMH